MGNGTVHIKTNQEYFYSNDEVTVQCNLGFIIEGTMDTVATLKCQNDGTWDKNLPKCAREWMENICSSYKVNEEANIPHRCH